jgi:trans-aconitate methyltransferase
MIRSTYLWNAEDYARHSSAQESWALELLASVDLADADEVLDVGCGDGRITAAIAARVPHGRVVGVDSSIDMVRHASSCFAASAHPNLSFELADAAALPFEDAFSVVFSNAALHWVRDHGPVIAGIARALHAGGRFVAQMGGAGNVATVIASFDAVMHRPRWRHDFEGFESTYGFHRAEDYARWLRTAGFEVHEARLIPKDMVHGSRAAFVGWLRSAWHPYTSAVSMPERQEFIEEVAADFLSAHPPDADGSIQVPGVRLQVRARKR